MSVHEIETPIVITSEAKSKSDRLLSPTLEFFVDCVIGGRIADLVHQKLSAGNLIYLGHDENGKVTDFIYRGDPNDQIERTLFEEKYGIGWSNPEIWWSDYNFDR